MTKVLLIGAIVAAIGIGFVQPMAFGFALVGLGLLTIADAIEGASN